MGKASLARLVILLLVVVYNFFFWGEKFGINLFIFTILLYVSLFLIERESFKRPNAVLFAGSTIFLSGLVAYNNSLLSIFIYFCSLTVSIGFIHQPQLRSAFYAIPTFIASYLTLPYTIIEETRYALSKIKYAKPVLRFTKLVIVPMLILTVFYVLYINANPIFAQASSEFWSYTDNMLVYLYENFPVSRGLFITFGLILIMGILFNRNIKLFANHEETLKEHLIRKEQGRLKYFLFKTTSLLNEYKISIILLVMVNSLILILNYIDIRYYWFDFHYYQGFDLRQFVHEGTYFLIISILLSMAILLYFFRGNLNFYRKNSPMKMLAYLWIIQNGIMAISVGVRNFYYIYYSHSLAYKRIGLAIFLILVFIGLITLYFKINKKYTFFRILKINSIAAYVVFLFASVFNWGYIIADFNFSHPDKEKVHYQYVVGLSDASLPVLEENKQYLNRTVEIEQFLDEEYVNALHIYEGRKEQFLREQQEYSWLSWNYSDWQVKKYYEK